MPMPKRKGIVQAIVGFFAAAALGLIIFGIFLSQHIYHGEQQLRALSEAFLLSESSKLETWVRSFQKAAELSLKQSSIQTSYGEILLPYEFSRYYYLNLTSSVILPYWQIYDEPIEFCNLTTTQIEQKNPNSYESNSGWNNAEYAYFSDNLRADTSPSPLTSSSIIYKGFNFEIPETEIKKVEVGVEWYTTNPSYEMLFVAVSWDNGINWYEIALPTQSSENLVFLDFSSATTWTREKLREGNFKVRLRAYNFYSEGGGGCYPNSTYILTFNQTHYIFKSPEEIKTGDLVPCVGEKLKICKVVSINKHFGEWEMVKLKIENKTLTLTSNHPVFLPELNEIKEAGKIKEGNKIYYLNKGKVETREVEKIERFKEKGFVYDVKLNESAIFFSKDRDSELLFENITLVEAIDMIIKETVYVDNVVARVTYKPKTKFVCNREVIKNYFKQKISLVTLNYLEDYREAYQVVSDQTYKIEFLENIRPRIGIDDANISMRNEKKLSFKRNFTDPLGNEIIITRKTYLTTYLYAKFGRILDKSLEIIENDFIGKCLINDSSLPICFHKKTDKTETENVLKNLEKNFEEKDIEVEFNLEEFSVSGQRVFGVVSVFIFDNTSSFLTYTFPFNFLGNNSIGIKFAIKAGDLISPAYQWKANTLQNFKICNSLGIFNKNVNCNYFSRGSQFSVDYDEGDYYFAGTCSDSTGDYDDICLGNILYEYQPFENNLCYFQKFSCECNNGRCKPSFCSDSDGLNYFVKGSVSYNSKQRFDFCYNDKTVSELYCENGYVSIKNYECKEDCYCNNGACQLPDSCKQLSEIIKNSFNSFCGEAKYVPSADLNKDGSVNETDLILFENNKCYSSFCSSAISNIFSPCKCGNGIVDEGEDCENCPEDVKCKEGEICCWGVCIKALKCPLP